MCLQRETTGNWKELVLGMRLRHHSVFPKHFYTVLIWYFKLCSLLQCFIIKLLIAHSVGDKASHTEEECSVSKLPSKQPSQNDCSAEAEIKTWEQVLLSTPKVLDVDCKCTHVPYYMKFLRHVNFLTFAIQKNSRNLRDANNECREHNMTRKLIDSHGP